MFNRPGVVLGPGLNAGPTTCPLLNGGRPGNSVLAPVATAAVAAALLTWLLLPGINGLVAAAFLDALRNASVWRALGVAAPLALFTAASRWPGLAGSVD